MTKLSTSLTECSGCGCGVIEGMMGKVRGGGRGGHAHLSKPVRWPAAAAARHPHTLRADVSHWPLANVRQVGTFVGFDKSIDSQVGAGGSRRDGDPADRRQ